jgi:hypothetical protein
VRRAPHDAATAALGAAGQGVEACDERGVGHGSEGERVVAAGRLQDLLTQALRGRA